MTAATGPLKLTITKTSGADAVTETWSLLDTHGHLTLTTPSGARIAIDRAQSALNVLEQVAAADDEMLSIYRFQDVRIEASKEVADILPLRIRISDAEPSIGGLQGTEFVEACAERGDMYYPVDVAGDYSVTINDELWVVVTCDKHPVLFRGTESYLPANMLKEWASWGFWETASMTSGWDSSSVGLLTDRIVAVFDSMDEGPKTLELTPFTSTVEAMRNWIRGGWLLDELSSTWDAEPDGCDDFIVEGFRALARTGGRSLHLAGCLEADDVMGVGRTPSSEWTFACSLPTEALREVVGESSPVAIARYDRSEVQAIGAADRVDDDARKS